MQRFNSTEKVTIHGRGEIFNLNIKDNNDTPKIDENIYINNTLYKVCEIERHCIIKDPFISKGGVCVLVKKIDIPLQVVKN